MSDQAQTTDPDPFGAYHYPPAAYSHLRIFQDPAYASNYSHWHQATTGDVNHRNHNNGLTSLQPQQSNDGRQTQQMKQPGQDYTDYDLIEVPLFLAGHSGIPGLSAVSPTAFAGW